MFETCFFTIFENSKRKKKKEEKYKKNHIQLNFFIFEKEKSYN